MTFRKVLKTLFPILVIAWLVTACEGKMEVMVSSNQERLFGQKLDSAVLALLPAHAMLDTSSYALAYRFTGRLLADIYGSGFLSRSTYLPYTVRIIDTPKIECFELPGGYLYLNTGLLKYLDNGAQLAGLLAHQVTHIDLRQTMRLIEDKEGAGALLDIIIRADTSSLLALAKKILDGDGYFSYNMNHEVTADSFAYKYLVPTGNHPMGMAFFLEKVLADTPYSAVPSINHANIGIDKRLTIMRDRWMLNGEPAGELLNAEYLQIKSSLP